jgi:acyl-CoA synthetase (AMP-forming)/AMP-acid ligase II
MHLTEADVNVQWLPLYHDMGFIGVLMFIGHGVRQYLWRSSTFIRDPAGWLLKFSELRGTIYTGPNFSYEFMLAAVTDEQRARMDLSAWRVALNGAEHVDFGCIERFLDRFRPAGFKSTAMCPCYGLAESTVAVSIASPDAEVHAEWFDRDYLAREGRISPIAKGAERARVLACVGPPIPGHKVRIIGPHGRDLQDGQIGEIEVSGPSVFRGYRGRQEETDAVLHDGWLRTGDLGFLLDGRLYVSGRIKETMIIRGRKFFADDVEPIVRGLPGVHRGRCVAVALGNMGEERMAVVVETAIADRNQVDALVAAIRGEVGTKLGLADLTVLPVGPRLLPQTTSGKFKRTQIRAEVRKAWRGKDVFDAPWGTNV